MHDKDGHEAESEKKIMEHDIMEGTGEESQASSNRLHWICLAFQRG